MELFQMPKDADLGAINNFFRHSTVFVDPKDYAEKLDHTNPLVRAIAIYGLCVLQRKEYLKEIINILRNDESEIVRIGCIVAFTFLNTADVSSELEFVLNDKSDMVKITLLDYYTKKKYSAVKEKVIKLIDTNNDMLKIYIFDYIVSLKLIEYKDLIYKELFSVNPMVTQNAILALMELNVNDYNSSIIENYVKNANPLISMTIDWLKER